MKNTIELKPKRGQKIKAGDYFGIPLGNGEFVIGQILGQYELVCGIPCLISNKKFTGSSVKLEENDIISALFVTELLLKRYFPIIQAGEVNKDILLKYFPNIENLIQGNTTGMVTHQTGVVEEFVKAYFGLAPWDDWYDPEYFDKLLVSSNKKPANPIYKNK